MKMEKKWTGAGASKILLCRSTTGTVMRSSIVENETFTIKTYLKYSFLQLMYDDASPHV